MSKLLLTVLVVGLAGCIASTSPIESSDIVSDNDSTSSYFYEGKSTSKGWNMCVPYFVTVVDDSTWLVELPSLCDHTPYIFKGDPGPDVWKQYENEDPVWQEKIIQLALRTAENEQ